MPGIDLTSTPAMPGLYGKLPILGDFVSRRLPSDFIRPWDDWIQAALSASKEQLGSHWLDVYLTSPIWRFVLGRGNCGDDALAGVLMPSVDRVGRYFPLTLAAVIEPSAAPANLFITASAWFEDLERLALSALTEDFALEEFDRQLQDRRMVLTPAAKPDAGGGTATDNGRLIYRSEVEKLEDLSDAFAEMSVRLIASNWPSFTLWSTNGSENLNPSLLVYNGLPPAEDFSGFLSGIGSTGRGSPHQPAHASNLADATDVGISVKWRSSARSNTGKVRELNEDAFLEKPDIGLWAVADGMGGHLAGDEASRAVVEALQAIDAGNSINAFSAKVAACLQATNTDLIERARKMDPHQIMGSTVVVMLAMGGHCASLWAGDSRLYRWRSGLLSQLTRDHSMASEIGSQDSQSPDMSVPESRCNIVTRALGAAPELDLDIRTFEARPGDVYVLCSDGLIKEVTAQEINAIISGPDCVESSRALIDLALARGARDNVTVIVVVAEDQRENTP